MTKILLVEDDKSLREIYGVRLLAEGYDIVSAGDGEQALAMAIKEKPVLIISDVMMPKISGFDMLDILRSTTETRDIKVIMMTALSSDDQRARGEQLGADRYLVKSQVGIEDVVHTVHEVLGDSGNVVPGAVNAPASAPTSTEPAATDDATAAPAQTSTPSLAATEPTPQASSLPQPTAPFSSPRPATLGERVITPLDSTEPAPDASFKSQIEQELQAPTETPSTQVDTPDTPAPAAGPVAVASLPATDDATAAPAGPAPTTTNQDDEDDEQSPLPPQPTALS